MLKKVWTISIKPPTVPERASGPDAERPAPRSDYHDFGFGISRTSTVLVVASGCVPNHFSCRSAM